MRIAVLLASVVLILLVLMDGFETVVQPRRVTRRYRIARLYYASLWAAWRTIARRITTPRKRAAFLSVFGPLSLLGIFTTWVVSLVLGFGLLHWGLNSPIVVTNGRAEGLFTYFYLSGTTIFTLGYGDVTPTAHLGRALAVAESGLGFGFLAAILSYLPALFQAYSRREVSIALLDARAGSPCSAGQLILRAARAQSVAALEPFFVEWERWAAELLEGQLSFPILGYYRSQHDNQSWLAAIATMLDACAVLLTQVRGLNTYQTQVTFAISRHAAVDLSLVLRAKVPSAADTDRLPSAQLAALRSAMQTAGLDLVDADAAEGPLRTLRGTYEPFLRALAERLLLNLPPLTVDDGSPDNWQRSAWMRPAPGIGRLPVPTSDEGHFG